MPRISFEESSFDFCPKNLLNFLILHPNVLPKKLRGKIQKKNVRRPVAFSTIPSMPHAQIPCLGIVFRDTRLPLSICIFQHICSIKSISVNPAGPSERVSVLFRDGRPFAKMLTRYLLSTPMMFCEFEMPARRDLFHLSGINNGRWGIQIASCH